MEFLRYSCFLGPDPEYIHDFVSTLDGFAKLQNPPMADVVFTGFAAWRLGTSGLQRSFFLPSLIAYAIPLLVHVCSLFHRLFSWSVQEEAETQEDQGYLSARVQVPMRMKSKNHLHILPMPLPGSTKLLPRPQRILPLVHLVH